MRAGLVIGTLAGFALGYLACLGGMLVARSGAARRQPAAAPSDSPAGSSPSTDVDDRYSARLRGLETLRGASHTEPRSSEELPDHSSSAR